MSCYSVVKISITTHHIFIPSPLEKGPDPSFEQIKKLRMLVPTLFEFTKEVLEIEKMKM